MLLIGFLLSYSVSIVNHKASSHPYCLTPLPSHTHTLPHDSAYFGLSWLPTVPRLIFPYEYSSSEIPLSERCSSRAHVSFQCWNDAKAPWWKELRITSVQEWIFSSQAKSGQLKMRGAASAKCQGRKNFVRIQAPTYMRSISVSNIFIKFLPLCFTGSPLSQTHTHSFTEQVAN